MQSIVLDGPLLINVDDITFQTPNQPFSTSGGLGEIFVGHHKTAGKVAVKRLRRSLEGADDEVWVRVSYFHERRARRGEQA